MRLVVEGRFGRMVALHPPDIRALPLRQTVGRGRIRTVPLDSDVIRSARDLDIGFGD
jgi:6-phosphofructokinase 1